jgi:hypothetical protein
MGELTPGPCRKFDTGTKLKPKWENRRKQAKTDNLAERDIYDGVIFRSWRSWCEENVDIGLVYDDIYSIITLGLNSPMHPGWPEPPGFVL